MDPGDDIAVAHDRIQLRQVHVQLEEALPCMTFGYPDNRYANLRPPIFQELNIQVISNAGSQPVRHRSRDDDPLRRDLQGVGIREQRPAELVDNMAADHRNAALFAVETDICHRGPEWLHLQHAWL